MCIIKLEKCRKTGTIKFPIGFRLPNVSRVGDEIIEDIIIILESADKTLSRRTACRGKYQVHWPVEEAVLECKRTNTALYCHKCYTTTEALDTHLHNQHTAENQQHSCNLYLTRECFYIYSYNRFSLFNFGINNYPDRC